MKRISVLSMLFAGLLVAAPAVVALANMNDSDQPASEQSGIPGQERYEGAWQYEGPAETGSLPPGEDLSNAQTGVTDEFPLHEGGGLIFREGVDTE